ncbi:MAG: DUF386 domain-containing protein [Ruminococcaceae bacterium]|nr:DUF386 domain-containing protein [Oscillospiraceae bacterium]
MIFDKLEQSSLYYGVHERFEAAFAFIKKAEEENLPVGKYELDGKNLYAIVQEYTTKAEEEGKFEGHEKYIDIQYVISGIERIEVVDIKKAVPKTEYNAEKDVTFYEDSDQAGQGVIGAGDYGIFFPHDIHKPGLTFGTEATTVRKIVVKIKM